MYESPNGETTRYFPIAITDPTNIGINVYNKNSFARIDNLTSDDDYWKFVSADGVLLPYGQKAELPQYNALIGNTNLKSSSSYNYKQPSLVYDITTNKQYFIYGHRFLYDQNEQDEATRLFAKSYLFVMGLDCNVTLSQFKQEGFHPYIVPFEMLLLIGAAKYRMDYMDGHDGKDLIIYDNKTYKGAKKDELYMRHPISKKADTETLNKYKPNTVTKPGFVLLKKEGNNNGDEYFSINDCVGEMYGINSKFAETAKEFFVNWTNKSFNNINGYLEIYKVGEDSKIYPYNGDEFVKFVNDNSKTT